MSSDIYIPLDYVLTHPELFELSTDYNVGIDEARDAMTKQEPDWDWIEQCIQPVLMCKFFLYPHYRFVDITGTDDGVRSLHVPAGGDFRRWLGLWLMDRNVPFEILE